MGTVLFLLFRIGVELRRSAGTATTTLGEERAAAAPPIDKWFLVVSSIPWLLIIAAYVEALAAWYFLGHWPRPMLDDPKNIATKPLHLIYVLLLLGFVPAFFLLVLLTVSNCKAIRARSLYSVGWVIFVLGAIALFFVVRADPGNVWEWLAD